MSKINDLLTGFRTILAALFGFLLVFIDVFIGGLTGFSRDALYGAAMVAAVVTLKQIKTDVIPKLQGRLFK